MTWPGFILAVIIMAFFTQGGRRRRRGWSGLIDRPKKRRPRANRSRMG